MPGTKKYFIELKARVKDLRDQLAHAERELKYAIMDELKAAGLPSENVLSRREEIVFSLLVQGKLSKEIAMQLNISNRTVKFHISNILHKSGFKCIRDLLYSRLSSFSPQAFQ